MYRRNNDNGQRFSVHSGICLPCLSISVLPACCNIYPGRSDPDNHPRQVFHQSTALLPVFWRSHTSAVFPYFCAANSSQIFLWLLPSSVYILLQVSEAVYYLNQLHLFQISVSRKLFLQLSELLLLLLPVPVLHLLPEDHQIHRRLLLHRIRIQHIS